VYVIGMFGVTLVGNVPLNNRLDAVDPASQEGAAMWREYLARWTPLNHARTVACTVSMALLVLSL
ncbi:MAG: anthrone oxygenase family protein, partial [Pseudomonadota bacterium]